MAVRKRALALVAVILVVAAGVAPGFVGGDASFTGQVQLNGNPAQSGTTYTYDLRDLDSASNLTAEFTGHTATERDDVTAYGVSNGGTVSLDVAGDLDPTGPAGGEPRVIFTGTETTSSWSATATGVGSGATKSVTVPGNVDPSSESVTFTGRESTSAKTVGATGLSDGGTFSYSVGGNVPAEGVSVTFTGNSQTTPNDQIASGISAGASSSISVGGNLDPVGPSASNLPELTVTAHKLTGSNPTSGGTGVTGQNTEYEMDAYPSGKVNQIEIEQGMVDGDESLDIYIVKEGMDGVYGEGTLVKSGYQPSSNGWATINLDTPVDLSGASAVTVEIVRTSGTDFRMIGTDASSNHASSGGSYYARWGNIKLHSDPQGLTVSADGSNSASHNFGDMADGGTATVEFALSEDATALTFSDSGGSFDYTLDKDDKTATEDPGIDVDGDGTTDYSYSGVLMSGETSSSSLSNLATGSHTASVSLAGGTVDVDVDMTEVTATEDPGLDLDGDGSVDASYSGILRSGQTANPSAEALTQGSATLEASLTAGIVDYSVTATGRTHTEDPSIDLDGDGTAEASHSGILSPGTTSTSTLASLSKDATSATISTAGGSTTDVEVELRERQRSTNPAVIVNGNRLGTSTTLNDGESVVVSGSESWLQTGQNTVEVRVGESVSADAPTPKVGLTYTHKATDKIVATYTSETWTERYEVSKTFNSSQKDVVVELDHSDDVVAVRSLEYKVNGGSWQTLTSAAYRLNGSTVEAELGDFTAGDKVTVRDAASKVKVHNGDISVEDPTPPGQRLNTAIRFETWSSDSYIAVGGTTDGNLVHHTKNESWTGADEYSVIKSDGTQHLYAPGASASSLARVSTIPVEAAPTAGDVRVEVENPTRTEPEFLVAPGPGGSNDNVEFTFLDAKDSTDYILWSVTHEVVRDSGTASSPITLTDDDSEETLAFLVDSSSSGSTGPTGGTGLGDFSSGAVSAGASIGDAGIIVLVGGLIAAAWVLSREFGGANISYRTLFIAEGVIVALLTLELASGYSIVAGVAAGIANFGKFAGLGLQESMPLALLVIGGLGYLAIRRWGRPQVIVNRSFSIGGSEKGGGKK